MNGVRLWGVRGNVGTGEEAKPATAADEARAAFAKWMRVLYAPRGRTVRNRRAASAWVSGKRTRRGCPPDSRAASPAGTSYGVFFTGTLCFQ